MPCSEAMLRTPPAHPIDATRMIEAAEARLSEHAWAWPLSGPQRPSPPLYYSANPNPSGSVLDYLKRPSTMLKIHHAANPRSIQLIWRCEELALPCEIVKADLSPADSIRQCECRLSITQGNAC